MGAYNNHYKEVVLEFEWGCAIVGVLTLTRVANHVLILTIRIYKGTRITSMAQYNLQLYVYSITPASICKRWNHREIDLELKKLL